MGQASRIARSERFIEHFGELLSQHADIKVGETLTVTDIIITQREASGEEVVFEVVLQRADGSPLSAELPFGSLFDPEYDSASDVVERLEDLFDIDPEETKKRLQAADLV